ncbi:hypothetical protein [Haloferax mediterranei]|uniref:hypothetical protein n=1 Tax=Haloferax mediterranei TaxID=2252 RepID=UPI001E3FA7D3|nr:hypothetical protein [Haloferax mediterranei]
MSSWTVTTGIGDSRIVFSCDVSEDVSVEACPTGRPHHDAVHTMLSGVIEDILVNRAVAF